MRLASRHTWMAADVQLTLQSSITVSLINNNTLA
jgi:hypothetical protein